ncbi:MAG: TIM barrel protein [Lutispora sp.]|nr:TIM barrel protein [Lutispora sp.]MDD4834684.1 TIM barrel protein [Lutispora sp.]
MSYKLGMPTLIEKSNIFDNVLLCKELGLDFVELNLNLPYCMDIPAQEMLKLKEIYDIDFTIHFHEDVDFGYFYEEIRQANINLFRNIAIWANKFGVEKINIHLNPGVYFTLPEEKIFVYEKYKEIFMEKFIDSMDRIVDIANPLGIKVCVENMKVYEFMKETFIKLIGIDNLYFTWDVGHDAMSDYIMEKIYLENPHKVNHMHMHDYNGISDHQIISEGIIPIKERINFAKENNVSVVIETKTEKALRQSVKKLRLLR